MNDPDVMMEDSLDGPPPSVGSGGDLTPIATPISSKKVAVTLIESFQSTTHLHILFTNSFMLLAKAAVLVHCSLNLDADQSNSRESNSLEITTKHFQINFIILLIHFLFSLIFVILFKIIF